MRHRVRADAARRLARLRRGAAAGAVLALIASACVTVQVVSAPPASAAAPGPAPAGQWPFSEGSGTTTADSSGNSHTGTLGSGVTWAAPEVGAHSIATNGTAAGAVTITGAVVNTSLSYTVSAWVYLTAIGGGNETFVSINGVASPIGTTISGFFLQFLGSTDRFAYTVQASDTTAATVTQALGPANVTANTWYHLVAVYNTSTIALYINGVAQPTAAYTTGWQATGNTMIGQGMSAGAATYFASGRIDDVALYSSALTTAQVAALNQPTISSGFSHTCEITSGNAYCWGLNASGELGDNSTTNSTVPVPVYTGGVLSGVTLTQISAGDNFTCALGLAAGSSTGTAYCWGGGSNGQLGSSPVVSQSSVPVAVLTGGSSAITTGTTLTQIDAGNGTACALSSAGAAYCWGLGTSGQLGNSGVTSSNAAVAVSGGLTFAQISAGGTTGTDGGFVCGVTTAGAAYCWGGDDNTTPSIDDQLGNTAAANPQTTPLAVTVGGSSAILSTTILTQVTTGSNFACALSNAGAAYCWGSGNNDQLGDGSSASPQATAVAVTTTGVLSGVTLTEVNAGNTFVCALGSTGAAYCWGLGHYGDLGNNSTANTSLAVAVSTSGVLSGVTLTQVSPAGSPFVCALDTSGTAYCWGQDTYGEADNPDTATSSTVPVTVALSQPTTISAGNIHSCEIDAGLAHCWGDNSNGELGNGSTMISSVPVAAWTGGALSGVTLTEITTGTNFSCALSDAGAAYCWGGGASGQLGNGLTPTTQSTAVAVTVGGSSAIPTGTTLTQITANGASVCALASTGAAYCWGLGTSGQLGNSGIVSSSLPVAVTTSGVLSGLILTGISAGGTSTCALASTGAAYCWGAGSSGQLGNGTTTATQSTAVTVTAAGGVLAGVTLTGITASGASTCALASTGVAFCWGVGTYGALGNGTTTAAQSTAVAVTTTGVLSGVTLTQIEAGSNSSCALSSAGAAYCWGGGGIGQLGNGTTTATQSTAVAVTATGVLSGVNLTQITVGTTFVCALGNTGAAFCWGANSNGQDGNPATAVNALVPVAVMAQATMIATGYNHSCLLRNGKAYCWGDNTDGELGNNSTTQSDVPVAVSTSGVLAGLTLIQITAGQTFTCALASTGKAFCWGFNTYGQLGNSSFSQSLVPVAVTTSGVLAGVTLTQISAGNSFTCALSAAGTAYCWGYDNNGNLGNNGTTNIDAPAAVYTAGTPMASKTVTQVSAGYDHTCALDSTGTAYCWGFDADGQLGNGSTTQSLVPVAVTKTGVLSGSILTGIASGNYFSCALGTNGQAYCWGGGANGELGNGSTTAAQSTAVAVTIDTALTGVTLTQLTAGQYHTCAVGSNGQAYCWGQNNAGQLGNTSNTDSSTAVAVTITGVLAGVNLTQISAEYQHTCALDTTGAAYCWGLGTTGQLGNNAASSSNVAVIVQGIVPGAPTSVAAFPASTTAAVYWAAPASLGAGTLTGYIATASPSGATCSTTTALTCTITGLTNGTTYTVTVVTETTNGNSPSSTAATVTPWPPEAIAAGGRESSCTIYSGEAYCWGDDTYGQLGNGVTTSAVQPSTPVAVYTGGVLAGVTLTQITMGYWHVCALASTGAVYCWGYDVDGELGNGTTSSTPSNVPVLVSGGLTFTQISAGQYSTCAVSSAGAAYCWGLGSSGQLGKSGSTASSSTPQAVTTTGVLSGKTVVQVAAGYDHTCALDNTGVVYCWGIDTNGELGTYGTGTGGACPCTSTTAAVAVYTAGALSGRTIVQITAGSNFTCALDSTGLVYCWGYGVNGQLGDNGTPTSQSVPASVYTTGTPMAGVAIASISVSEFQTCALGSTGVGFCWGYNADGRLGTNNTTTVSVPTAVYIGGTLAGRTLAQINAGDQDGCALDSTGTAYCWGTDANGQLGNDATAQVTAAVLVGPQAPTNVTATPGDTTAAMSWTTPVYLNNGTVTGYTFTTSPGAFTCTTTGATSCTITGLTDGTTYTVTGVTTTNTVLSTTGTSEPSIPPTPVEPVGFLTLTSPTSLTWALTDNGFNQSAVDTVAGDQQLTATDNTETGNGWHIAVSATTFTTGTYTLPDTAAADFTGSILSYQATTAPTATCVASCTLPTDSTVYPVAITTAPSAPTTYTVYDTAAATGEAVMTIGGSTAAHPIGWWVQAPASTRAGTYTSTVTLQVISGP